VAGPDVRYAQNAGINIAYQVFGEGPRDLVFVCGTMSNLDLFWSGRSAPAMLERLGRFSRVILFDKPGTGLSDPIPAAPTIDQRIADIVAVMDAATSDKAVVVGYSEGGLPAMMLAATQPHRVEALVLLETLVAMDWQPDISVGPEVYDQIWAVMDEACERWGQGVLMAALAPTWVDHPVYGPLLGSIERACMSPGMARSVLQGYHGMDMRDVATAIHVPTLILQSHSPFVTYELGLDLAQRIDGVRFVELTGVDHVVWIHNGKRFPDAVEEFLTGRRHSPSDDDRVLTTVVFTDIVDSTRQIAAAGDERWRTILADHDDRMDELLAEFGGLPIKHTGDGRLAHFARPARAVRFATAMTEAARSCGLEIRVGIHTGECESVGSDLIGLAVNIGARVAALAEPNEVLVSSTVTELVIGSGLAFTPRGQHDLKGAPGRWALYRYEDDRPGPLVAVGYDTDVRNEGAAGS
jgi:class 3 adenylate cyclase